MRLELLGSSLAPNTLVGKPEVQTSPGSFFEYFSGALRQVDQLSKEASQQAQQVALGEQEFLHNSVLAYEKASLALQLTIEIRNRLLESYQEIMRMQL